MKFETILTELRSEKFEWFGPSPIEPFNLGAGRAGGGSSRGVLPPKKDVLLPPKQFRGGGRRLSWKVRCRIFLWFFSQMSKLYRARSTLYRRQILQVNIRWKALDEIYKIYMLLHRSDLNISENVRQTFSHLLANFCKNSLFLNSFHWFLLRFWWIFVRISPRF